MIDSLTDQAREGSLKFLDLTASRSSTSYSLQFLDTHLQAAAEDSLKEGTWTSESVPSAATFVVTDDLSMRGPKVVLVVDDAPGSCQAVLQALLQEEIVGVASRSEMDRLPLVLAAASGQMASIPTRVVRASLKLPRVEERKRQVLELLATGLSNTAIASQLHVSQATVKREVSELLHMFKASNRLELAMRSAEAGLVDASRSGRGVLR